MPDFLKNLEKTCEQIHSIEEGLRQIEYWIIEGENFLKTEPDQYNYEQITRIIEKKKVTWSISCHNSYILKFRIYLYTTIYRILYKRRESNKPMMMLSHKS